MNPLYPTRDTRDPGLANGDPAAFADLANSAARNVAGSVPNANAGSFGLALMDLLRQYQQLGTKPFVQQQLNAQDQQTQRLQASELIGASPALQSSVRQSQYAALQPTITGAEQGQRTFSEQLRGYADLLDTARQIAAQASQSDLAQQRLALLALNGVPNAPTAYREFELAQQNPAFGRFLDRNRNASNANNSLPTVPLAQDIGSFPGGKVTISGRPYIDLTNYDNKEKTAIVAQAHQIGIPVVDKDQADSLENLDTLRQTLQQLRDFSQNNLPKTTLSRAYLTPELQIKKFLKSPALANFDTLKTKAIGVIQGLATGKGLRITATEVQNALESLPNLYDTSPYATSKLNALEQSLTDKENSILVSNRQQLLGRPKSIRITGPQGTFDVSPDKLDIFIKNGYKQF